MGKEQRQEFVKSVSYEDLSPDKVSAFINKRREFLRELQEPVGRIGPHGRRRSKRQVGDISEDKKHRQNQISEALQIFDSGKFEQLTFLIDKESREILGFQITGR